jgi:subtilase family serine protease
VSQIRVSSRHVRRVAVSLVVGSLAVLSLGTGGAVAAKAPPPRIAVASVDTGILKRATPLSATASDTRMRISILLNVRHLSALKHRVAGGFYRPGRFLTEPQFAARYGQRTALVRHFAAYLRSHGLRVQVYRDRLNIAAAGPAAAVERIFQVKLHDYRVAGQAAHNGRAARPAQVVHGTTQSPTLPGPFARATLAVLGLTSYHGAFVSNARPARGQPHVQHAGSGPPPGQLVPADFLRFYHGRQLQRAGHGGAGQTIGIVTLATLPRADVFSFWHQLGIHVSPNRLTTRNIDGGAGRISFDAGSDETALDVEQSGAIAPRAKMIVYQAQNSDPGFNDAWFAAVSDNKADSISTSWGDSETFYQALISLDQEPTTYADTVDVPLLEADAQGQANFYASGDDGAFDAFDDLGSANLSVDVGAESPYTTAAGGTTLSFRQYPQVYPLSAGKAFTIKIPRERAWGWDYLFPEWRQFNEFLGTHLTEKQWVLENIAGGGGGFSVFSGMPAYQRQFPGLRKFSAVKTITPIDPTNDFPGFPPLPFTAPSDWALDNSPPTVSGELAGNHRLVPDLSANADPQTGYGVYTKLYKPIFGSDWVQYGGTSFTSPQFNGVSALLQGEAGGRVGLWNPAIYRFASSSHSPFRTLNGGGSIGQTRVHHTARGPVFTVPGNNNLWWSGRAGTRYNMAVGLGIPNLTELGRDFAHRGR